ncbi:MAG: biofilm-associated protein [Nitrosarchaeum sp.]|uniref:biofilm-associated protein n=1 Tax=Nitrosarchaeum sp. TaxID=2026886 RepID=UPI002DEFA8F0|nr:biofilm-associated protein [Nitrosarchaeum sp.]
MSKSSMRGIFLSLILCLTVAMIIPIYAYAEGSVSAKSFSFEETTIIEFTNTGNDDVSSFRIWLGSDNNFKSFKTENGWIGEKTPQGVIIFTSSSEVIKPGESIKIGVKTDKTSSGVNWKALDKSEQQIEIGQTIASKLPNPVTNSKPESKTTVSEGGILANSAFRIIPEKPNVGSTIRVTGDNFGAAQELDFFINSNKISSFVTNDAGYFITTVKIPENIDADRVDFIIKDKNNQEKSISLRLEEPNNRIPKSNDIKLTISGIPEIIHRTDFIEVSGTAQPNSGITASIKDPNGKIINTRTAKADAKGNWKVAEPIIVPLDAPFGRYSAVISDGRGEITTTWMLETSKVILIKPITLKFNPGETIKFNGTALPNKSLELILEDPLGNEKTSDIIEIDETGNVEFEYPTIANVDKEGTWTLIAEQDGKREFIYAGLGEIPSIPINIEFDKLNYKSTETAKISLTGKPSDKLTMLIVDPSDKPKIITDNKNTVSITLGQDGKKTYELGLSGYASGAYTAIINKGASKSSEVFTVGLQTGSGAIKIGSTKLDYRPGEPILILGDTKENSLLTLTLSDPDGTVWKTKEIFSDKNGKIADDSLRLPSLAEPGIWKVNAKSGSNFDNIEIEVITSKEEGLVVTVEEGIEISGYGKSINIKVINAEQTVEMTILNSDGEKMETLSFPSNKEGEIKQPWFIPKGTIPGTYTIKVKDAHNTAETTFTVK